MVHLQCLLWASQHLNSALLPWYKNPQEQLLRDESETVGQIPPIFYQMAEENNKALATISVSVTKCTTNQNKWKRGLWGSSVATEQLLDTSPTYNTYCTVIKNELQQHFHC